MSRPGGIPHFYLYGEALAEVELDFLHVEEIHLRSGMHDWIIRPHAHPDHFQFLLVREGGGKVQIESHSWQADPPALVVVPAAMVHALEFQPGTDGFVITVATAYLNAAAQEDRILVDAAGRPGVYPLDGGSVESDSLVDAFQSLAREFVWSAPGRRSAILAHFQRILVGLARTSDLDAMLEPSRHRDSIIVLRYRELVERHFRENRPLSFFADRLGITYSKLNSACRAAAGKSSLKILHDRVIIEAKRNLLYTSMPVGEVAHSVGFEDPAYFCRFFSQRAGIPPGMFRDMAERAQAGART